MENFTLGEKSAIKACFREYSQSFKEKLVPRMIVSFFVAVGMFVLYAFLIAYVNEGFWEHNDGLFTMGRLLQYIVSLEGSEYVQWVYPLRTTASFLVLPMACLLLGRCFAKITSSGLTGFFKSIIWNIAEYIDDLRYSQASTLLMLGAVSGTIIGAFIQNPVFILLLSMMIYLSAAAREKSMLINSLFVIWHDLLLLFRTKGIKIFYIDLVSAFLRGTALGLLIVSIAGIVLPHGYLYFLPALVLIVLTVMKLIPGLFRKKPGAQITLFCLCLAGFLFMTSLGIASAHDGGWVEGGANLLDWLRSDGALQVLFAALVVAALCYVSLSFAAVPMLGSIKGIADLIAGKDLISGQPLTGFDKALAVASFIPMCAAGKVLIQVGTMMSAFGNMGDSIGKGLSGALSGDYGSDSGSSGGDGSSDSGADGFIGDSNGLGGLFEEDIPRPDEEDDDDE